MDETIETGLSESHLFTIYAATFTGVDWENCSTRPAMALSQWT